MASFELINALSKMNKANTYLEIGVDKGETFMNVTIPKKFGVDPKFSRSVSILNGRVHLLCQTSDDFFEDLRNAQNNTEDHLLKGLKFDVVFIDGLHTFEQTWRDFLNVLPYTDEKSIIIFDDVIPCDPYSAIPDQEESYAFRAKAGLLGLPWHGDVFKCVFALHDFYKEYSYCTHFDGNPQTIVWKTERSSLRPSLFGSLEDINHLGYFDVIRHGDIFLPVKTHEVLELLGQQLDLQKYKQGDYKFLINKLSGTDSISILFADSIWGALLANMTLDARVYIFNEHFDRNFLQFQIKDIPKYLNYKICYYKNTCMITLNCEKLDAIIYIKDTFEKIAKEYEYDLLQEPSSMSLYKEVPVAEVCKELTILVNRTIDTIYNIFASGKMP